MEINIDFALSNKPIKLKTLKVANPGSKYFTNCVVGVLQILI